MVMGGIVPVVNLDGITPGQLVLDGPTLAKIYLGEIKTWNDAGHRQAQPRREAAQPADPRRPPLRRLGHHLLFTDYLSKVSPDWKSKVGSATAVEWPVGIGAKGNEGVANNVMQTKGSIGYVEYAYAKQNKLSHTRMINAAGKTVAPEPRRPSRPPPPTPTGRASPASASILNNQPGADAGRSPRATFILIHKQPKDPAAAADALKFFDWAYTKGDKMAEELDYIPMPEAVVKMVEASWTADRRHGGQAALAGHQLSDARGPGSRRSRGPILPSMASQILPGRRPACVLSARILRMVDASPARSRSSPPAPCVDRGKAPGALSQFSDVVFEQLTRVSAIAVLVILGGVIVSLVHGSLPTFSRVRLRASSPRPSWNPVTENASARPRRSTARSSPRSIAMLIAVPVGLGIAIFLTELCPQVIRAAHRHRHRAAGRHPVHHLRHLGPLLLRAVPAADRAALPDDTLGQVPGIGVPVRGSALRHRHAHGRADPRHHGAALHHLDLARRVRDGAADAEGDRPTAWAARRWEVVRNVVIPYTRVGVIGGIMLGARPRAGRDDGRHLRHRQRPPISASLLDPGTTISATIANEFTEAVGDLYTSSLIALGLHPLLHHLHRPRRSRGCC